MLCCDALCATAADWLASTLRIFVRRGLMSHSWKRGQIFCSSRAFLVDVPHHALIYRIRFVGRLVWNRLRYSKHPSTGRRVSRVNPPENWIVRDVPELRILERSIVGPRADAPWPHQEQRAGSQSSSAGIMLRALLRGATAPAPAVRASVGASRDVDPGRSPSRFVRSSNEEINVTRRDRDLPARQSQPRAERGCWPKLIPSSRPSLPAH
jgi:hypothetical protein